jgi:hypothetical protein
MKGVIRRIPLLCHVVALLPVRAGFDLGKVKPLEKVIGRLDLKFVLTYTGFECNYERRLALDRDPGDDVPNSSVPSLREDEGGAG